MSYELVTNYNELITNVKWKSTSKSVGSVAGVVPSLVVIATDAAKIVA